LPMRNLPATAERPWPRAGALPTAAECGRSYEPPVGCGRSPRRRARARRKPTVAGSLPTLGVATLTSLGPRATARPPDGSGDRRVEHGRRTFAPAPRQSDAVSDPRAAGAHASSRAGYVSSFPSETGDPRQLPPDGCRVVVADHRASERRGADYPPQSSIASRARTATSTSWSPRASTTLPGGPPDDLPV